MENLKECWCGARFRDTQTGTPDNRRKTALGKLAAHYNRFSNVALILTFCMPLWIWNMMHNGLDLNLWLRIAVVVTGMLFCITSSLMDRWLCKGISRIDVAEMPVSEVCRLAYYYRKKHFQFIAILLPWALMFIGLLIWMLPFDKWFLYGIAAGALVGGAIGIMQFRIFMAEYREITDDDAD